MNLRSFLTLTFVLYVCVMFSQKNTIENVLMVNLTHQGEIKNNSIVEGYFLLYSTGKAKKGFINYTIRILDTELNKVSDTELKLYNKTELLNVVSNGRSIMFRFWNPINRLLTLRCYSYDGKELFSKETEITSGFERAYLKSEGFIQGSLIAIKDYGFMEIRAHKAEKDSYKIIFINDDNKGNGFEIIGEGNMYEFVVNVLSDENVIINLIYSREKLFSTSEMTASLQKINVKNGEVVFEKNITELNLNAYYFAGKVNPDSENIVIYGTSHPEDKGILSKSVGIVKTILNKDGEVLETYEIKWEDFDISLDDNKKIENMFIHEFIETSDGHTYIVGEQMQISVGSSVASSILSQGTTSVYKIDDLVIIQMDEKFEFVNSEIVDKTKTSYDLGGIGMFGLQGVGMLAKQQGSLDYQNFQEIENGFQILYLDYRKKKDNGLALGAVTNQNLEYIYDKIDISKNNIETLVLQGKPGYVCLIDYNKNQKSLDLRLEKINY